MEKIELSIGEIAQYLEPFATAKRRTEDAGEDGLSPIDFGNDNLVTKNLTESVNLMRATYGRLETLLSNLTTIRDYSLEAADSTDARVRDNNKALIRNLARGIDLLVEQTQFSSTEEEDGQRIFDGSPVLLAAGNGQTPQEFKLENLYSSAEGLGLSSYDVSARVSYYYGGTTTQLNDNSRVRGLDITTARYADPDEGVDELEDGKYRIKVEYAGENSKVHLTDNALKTIRAVDVDLSGEGNEVVNFGNGVEISISKTNIFNSGGIDKYDFESNGPGFLYADLDYSRFYKHDIITDANNKLVKQSVMTNSTKVDDGVDLLEISGTRYDDAAEGEEQLADGDYTAKLTYLGANSNVMLYNSFGELIHVENDIDLTGSGATDVKFDNGLVLTVDRSELGLGLKRAEVNFTVRETTENQKYVPEFGSSETLIDGDASLTVEGFSEGTIGLDEEVLEKGKYTLELDYFGKHSLARLKDESGAVVLFKSNIDLSQDGSNEIDLGRGVKFTVNNTDYANSGTAKLSAEFEMVEAAQKNSRLTDTAASAGIVTAGSLQDEDDDGSLEIAAFEPSDTLEDEEELEKGRYSVEIDSFAGGKSSLVKLIDSDGNLVKMLGGVDLSGDGDTTVDLGVGVSVVVSNEDFSGTGKFSASFDYKPAISGLSIGFDFEAYAQQAEIAISVVEEQMTLVDDTFFQLNQRKVFEDELQRQTRSSTAGIPGIGVIGLLSSAVDSGNTSIFRPSISAQAQTNIQAILATAGTANQPRFDASSLVGSVANQAGSSVLNILGGG